MKLIADWRVFQARAQRETDEFFAIHFGTMTDTEARHAASFAGRWMRWKVPHMGLFLGGDDWEEWGDDYPARPGNARHAVVAVAAAGTATKIADRLARRLQAPPAVPMRYPTQQGVVVSVTDGFDWSAEHYRLGIPELLLQNRGFRMTPDGRSVRSHQAEPTH